MAVFRSEERQIAPREVEVAALRAAADRVDARTVRTLGEHWLSVSMGGLLVHDAQDVETLHALIRCQGVRNFLAWLEDEAANREDAR